MCFKDLEIKSTYRSVYDNIPEDFFNRVLPETKIYLRAAGYYSSNSLKTISEGLSKMIWEDGRMKLLISPHLSQDDVEAIRIGKTTPEVVIKNIFIEDRSKLQELMRNDNVNALSYLIATEKLEIKFVLSSDYKGLFHMKFGIFYDEDGDIISFSGSLNESDAGLNENAEELKVFKSWVQGQRIFIDPDLEFFNDIFEEGGKYGKFYTVSLPDEIKQTFSDVWKESKKRQNLSEPRELRYYQENAIDFWTSNEFIGIVEMATGTGKTEVGLEAMKIIEQQTKFPKMIYLIAVPTNLLVLQWEGRVRKDNNEIKIVLTTSGRDQVYQEVKNFFSSSLKNLCLIGTYSTLSSDWFLKLLNVQKSVGVFLIADEVHWAGAEKNSLALMNSYEYRLGLSATPLRTFDLEGTEYILNYFNKVVYVYTMKQAIRDGYLSKYRYQIYPCFLTSDEYDEYLRLTRRLIKISSDKDKQINSFDDTKLALLLSLRARIVKKANNKERVLENIITSLIERHGDFHHLLVFFEDSEQLNNSLQEISLSTNLKFKVIDHQTIESDRNDIIRQFNEGFLNFIVAMRVLDEGLDSRYADKAIFVASNSNPRQYIQRRGRILRIHEGKKSAEIHDIMVLPNRDLFNTTNTNDSMEKKLLRGEIKRAVLFCADADNRLQCVKEIENITSGWNIDIWEMFREVDSHE